MVATNLSKQTLSDRLTGVSPFKDEELLALAWLFDCDPGEFFRVHPNLTPSQEANRAKGASRNHPASGRFLTPKTATTARAA